MLWELCIAAVLTQQVAVPRTEIPPAVLAQLQNLESQFDNSLAQDCAVERCYSKGCTYVAHVVVDKPAATSLPGMGPDPGPGSIPAQPYLTQARCEFAHEKSIPSRDVQNLARRLGQKLSQRWLQVSVTATPLLPIPDSLRETPPQPNHPEPVASTPPAAPPTPTQWDAQVAGRELWLALLPHFPWMIGIALLTVAVLFVIWASRRLGRESLEERVMLLQLSQSQTGALAAAAPSGADAAPSNSDSADSSDSGSRAVQGAFVEEQRRRWIAKIDGAGFSRGDDAVADLLREWLKSGEFALLAKAVSVFAEHLTLTFPADGELALQKLQFAEYIKRTDAKLPSDADFFRVLNQHAVSSALLSQSDADAYRSLQEEFGALGVAGVMEALPPRYGALLFSLAPPDCQAEVARLLAPGLRQQVFEQLLLSNRIARDESLFIFAVLRAAVAGDPLPSPPIDPSASAITDRGREVDAAGALSMLMPYLPVADRRAAFERMWKRGHGAFPSWYDGIMSPDMLARIPGDIRTDLFLEVDVRSLAAWISIQQPALQQELLSRLPERVLGAMRANMTFDSRSVQRALATAGRQGLAAALQKRVVQGQLTLDAVMIGTPS